MEIEVIEPKREPLHFPVNLDGVSSDIAETVQAIKQAAEKVLYHWSVFPIILPPPLAVISVDGDGVKKSRPLIVRDLFNAPTFEELNIVSLDAKGDPQPLTRKHLQSIRETGEFEVESMNFPGQVHRWKLSYLLQKGVYKVHTTLLKDIALALHFLVVTARRRIFSDFFSITQSVHSFIHGLALLLDIFIGIPSLSARNLDVRIQEERSKYLVAELTVRSSLEDDVDNLCQFVKYQIKRYAMEKYTFENEKSPPVSYLYQTPKGYEIDLRLFNKELIRKALPIIAGILEKESRGWFIPFREKIIAELKTKKLTDEEIERQASILVLDEYLRRVFEAIHVNLQIQELGPGIGALLVEQAQSVMLMQRAVDNMHRRLKQTLAQIKTHLQSSHPVLSLIGPWVKEKLKIAEEEFMLDHQWDAHEEALALCRQHSLHQTSYFLQRDLTFMREREPVLKQELSRVRNPNRTFQWRAQIWCPHHWKIRKVFQGESETVPTVISHTSASLAQPRSDPTQPVYLIEKQSLYTTTTRSPFWRWTNYCFRTYTWLWNSMFLFGVVIPWCSPVSLRALFSIRPFKPDYELNQIDGILYPRKSSATHTLCSRLILLWRHISKSRTEFESRPDTGFIGKGFSRHLNRLWNYLVKGALGTVLLMFIFPVVCLVVSFLSLSIAFTAPLWVPASTFVCHITMLLIYDFDSPDSSKNKICIFSEAVVWHILLLGVVQPLAAFSVAAILCPLASFFVFCAAVIRYSVRLFWDFILFHFLIQKRGRIPATDSWLVKRIAGPGLSSSHYFQIRPEQALAAFEAKLETEELNAFREEVERIILLPQQTFSDFVAQCFQPFSATLSKEGVYMQLEKESQELFLALRDQVDRRKKELQSGLSANTRSKIKMASLDLQAVIRLSTLMVQKYFPTHVFKRLNIREEDYWEKKGLAFHDWTGLAAQLLIEVFSIDILTPLEESDTRYRLEAHSVNLSRYTEMLQSVEFQSDIDIGHMVHTSKGKIHVHSPYMDLANFNPLTGATSTTVHSKDGKRTRYPWKRKQKCSETKQKLVSPLPIPHPVHISIIIFNRENEDPISTENEVCLEILKAISDGAKSSAILSYNNEDTPFDEQSMATTVDEYRRPSSELHIDTGKSEDDGDRGSCLSLSCNQSQASRGSFIVNLASSEDITLEPDGERVTYSHSSYSTTV